MFLYTSMGRKVELQRYSQILAYQNMSSTWRSFHSHNRNDSYKSSIKIDPQKKKQKIGSTVYTDSQSSIQSIAYNKENYPIINQIYDILTELQAQDEKNLDCVKYLHTLKMKEAKKG